MKKYTTCFIGIPLPNKFQTDFEELLAQIHAIDPSIDTTYPKTPHITICYLDQQSQTDLPKIADVVKKSLGILKGVKIKVGGLGYFRGDDPKVMFLNVECPEEVEKFGKIITQDLSFYSATENNLPFHPHMTVAWLGSLAAKHAFKNKRQELDELLRKNWTFDLEEVGLYGVDSTKRPQFQEKLMNLRVIKSNGGN